MTAAPIPLDAATVERCAQVAEEVAGSTPDPPDYEYEYAHGYNYGLELGAHKAATDIADRIRALLTTPYTLADMPAEVAKLRAALAEVTDDLEAGLHSWYDQVLDDAVMRRRFHRDMQPVVRARALLASDGAPHG